MVDKQQITLRLLELSGTRRTRINIQPTIIVYIHHGYTADPLVCGGSALLGDVLKFEIAFVEV